MSQRQTPAGRAAPFRLCHSLRAEEVAGFVMPALVAGIHVLGRSTKKDVDGRVKPGHDGEGSHPLHKTIHYALFARFVEMDGELVAVHGGDVAVAELLVKHAVAG